MSSAEETARLEDLAEASRAAVIDRIRQWRIHHITELIVSYHQAGGDPERAHGLAQHIVDGVFRHPHDDLAEFPEFTPQ